VGELLEDAELIVMLAKAMRDEQLEEEGRTKWVELLEWAIKRLSSRTLKLVLSSDTKNTSAT